MGIKRPAIEAGEPGRTTAHMIERVTRGRDAEIAIAQCLKKLGRKYFVIHDFPLPRGNADHIVIGPTGVFVIETKGNVGEVSICDGAVRINGYRPDRDPIQQARNASRYVRGCLRDAVEAVGWVLGVVCFERAWLEKSVVVNKVLVTRPAHLRHLIRHWNGRRLPDADVVRTFEILKAKLPLSAGFATETRL
jgi:hypothetical protein